MGKRQGPRRLNPPLILAFALLAASLRSMRPRASRWMADGTGAGSTAVQADSKAKARMRWG